MQLRKVTFTGGVVAASSWLMPDGTLASVKLPEKVYRGGVGLPDMGVYLAKLGLSPDPQAIFVAAAGGIAAIAEEPDGYPVAGDCWEIDAEDDDGKPLTVLHVQIGDDPMGAWRVQNLDANGDVLVDVSNTHAVRLTEYDTADPVRTTVTDAPDSAVFVQGFVVMAQPSARTVQAEPDVD